MIGSGAALLVLALGSVSGSGTLAKIERITPEVAAERVAQCGLGSPTLRYEDELQSFVLTLANATSATEKQLACVDEAASYHDVELPAEVQPRFNAIKEARRSAIILAEARNWLSARGLLERVPKYVPGVTDEAAFTRDLETLCGPAARGAFQSQYGYHVLSPHWGRKREMPPSRADQEAFSCLLNATTVVGFELGIIAHAAYPTADSSPDSDSPFVLCQISVTLQEYSPVWLDAYL